MMAGLYSLLIGLCAGAFGIALGLWIGDTLLDAGFFKPNADIEGDAMIISMGFAFGGGFLGLLAGTVSSWRFLSSRTVRR